MKTHQECLALYCRLCGKTSLRSMYDLKTSLLEHEDLSVSWQRLIKDICDVNTDIDDPTIHPSKCCHSCKLSLTKYIEDPTRNCNNYIKLVTFLPHPSDEDRTDCIICKQHTQSKAGGRPPKVKRGGKRSRTEELGEDVAYIKQVYCIIYYKDPTP